MQAFVPVRGSAILLRRWTLGALLPLAILAGCGGSAGPGSPGSRGESTTAPGGVTGPAGPGATGAKTGGPLQPRDDLPPDSRALMMIEGQERWVEAGAAAAAGYTIVDLSDEWTPEIFAERVSPDGAPLHNRYRRVFIGLANDKLDADGLPLAAGEKNYLELYGIFPSLSVLRQRFLDDAEHPCHDEQSVAALEAVETVTYVAPEEVKRDERKLARLRAEVEAARQKAKVETLEDLARADPKQASKVKVIQKRDAEKIAMEAVEKRLACEGLLTEKSRHTTGIYDDAMRLAVRRFQQKHMIYESNYLRRKTVDALARPLLQNDYEALVRALRERVVGAAGIVEDGTVGSRRNPPVRDLVEEATKATIAALGLTDADTALAWFKRRGPDDFKSLRVAVKLPPPPAYYGPHMDLQIVVDRGDVWYDLPFDAAGKFTIPPRKKYPTLTVYVRHEGQQIPLVRWRTTIGGWRAEQASDGYEYYRYKGSDVGPRVIRNVVAGPVWIAPASTPIRSLVKPKSINGRWMRVVNYDELGPGYLSAYGLVAGYFVVPGKDGKPDWDNGVRAHGSADYLSIYSANGFSHGCHRLPNHLAIRLYSFLLKHRTMRVVGDQPMGFSRQFLFGDSVYEMRIPSKGYVFQLDPPLPVNVLEGEIKGTQKKPIQGYVPKPGVRYPGPPPATSEGPESKSGGTNGEGAP